MKIVFATNNKHKLQEIREILGEGFDVVSLAEIGCHDDIPENGLTLKENAFAKAKYVFDKYGLDCFADDTGLEVEALGGEPGVHSARYAEGTDHDSEANMAKLLRKMQGKSNRNARFCTIIALLQKGKEPLFFEGEVRGHIATEKKGNCGFGYDPLFVPQDSKLSFAEMGDEAKNSISHRGRAVRKLAEYLKSKH